MFNIKILKISYQALFLLVILYSSVLSLAEDICSDNIGRRGLPTIPGNYIKPDNWSSEFHFDPNNPQELSRNNSISIKIIGGTPPYSWSVVGDGFSLLHDQTMGLSNELTADDTVCGSATIYVTESFQSQASESIRVPDYGKWVSQGSWNAVIPRSGYAWDCLCGQDWDSSGCYFDVVWCKGKCCCFNGLEDWCNLNYCCDGPLNSRTFYALGVTGSVVWGTYVGNFVEHKNLALIEQPNAYNCDNAPYNWSWPSQVEVDGQSPPCSPGECGAIIGSDCVTGGPRDRGKPIGVRKIWAYKYVCQ